MLNGLRLRDLASLPASTLARAPRQALRAAKEQLQLSLEEALEEPGFRDAWEACLPVPGWLDRRAARLLYGLARHGPGAGAIVEIGSYLGRSTVVLARGSEAGGREPVVAIDPHGGALVAEDPESGDTFPLFLRNLIASGVRERVEAVKATSEEAAAGWDRPIRLLYVDGLHHYEAVMQDIELWTPHLVPEGVVVFDDYAVGGVQGAIRDARARGLLPDGLIPVGEAAVCGIRDAGALRAHVFPRTL